MNLTRLDVEAWFAGRTPSHTMPVSEAHLTALLDEADALKADKQELEGHITEVLNKNVALRERAESAEAEAKILEADCDGPGVECMACAKCFDMMKTERDAALARVTELTRVLEASLNSVKYRQMEAQVAVLRSAASAFLAAVEVQSCGDDVPDEVAAVRDALADTAAAARDHDERIRADERDSMRHELAHMERDAAAVHELLMGHRSGGLTGRDWVGEALTVTSEVAETFTAAIRREATLVALGQACDSCGHIWCQSERASAGRIVLLDGKGHVRGEHGDLHDHIGAALRLRALAASEPEGL